MKKYTQKEFDAIPRDRHGIKNCPTGDYTEIKNFPDNCNFGKKCTFSKQCTFDGWCNFGIWCNFDECCSFGENCKFDEGCIFDEQCDFGESCKFDESCKFGGWCIFDEWCTFNDHCKFGESCKFGEWCTFYENCKFGEQCAFGTNCFCEFGVFKGMTIISGFGSKGRTTYFFLLENNTICVRSGCFAGTLDEWKDKVKETHGDNKYAKSYLLAANAVVELFSNE